MPCSFPKRRARHGAGPRAASPRSRAWPAPLWRWTVPSRHAPATLRGAKDVLAAAAISAAVLAAVAVLVIITWGALRLGRRLTAVDGGGTRLPRARPDSAGA